MYSIAIYLSSEFLAVYNKINNFITGGNRLQILINDCYI